MIETTVVVSVCIMLVCVLYFSLQLFTQGCPKKTSTKFSVRVTWVDSLVFEDYCLGDNEEDAMEDMRYRYRHGVYSRFREGNKITYGEVKSIELIGKGKSND